MLFTKNIAFTYLTFVALTLAVSQAGAAVTDTTPHTAPAPSAPVTSTLKDSKPKPKTKLKLAKNDTIIYVKDLHCKHCAKKIASKLYAVKGVVKVRTDLKADVAIVTPQNKKKLDPMALWTAANKSGFPALKLVGPSGRYVLDPKTKSAQRLPDKTTSPKS